LELYLTFSVRHLNAIKSTAGRSFLGIKPLLRYSKCNFRPVKVKVLVTNEEQKHIEIWDDYVKITTNTTFDLSTKKCLLLLHFLSKTNK
jgi:hypothetical protein